MDHPITERGPAGAMIRALLAHPRWLPGLVALVGFAALAGALMAEHLGGLKPCVLCWYQRYAYLAALVVGLLGVLVAGAVWRRRVVMALAALIFLTGAGIAFFHVGVEQLWWRGTDACHAPAFDPSLSVAELRERMLATDFVPCDRIAWSFLGLSMAGYNVIASLTLALGAAWAVWRLGRERAP